MIDILKKSFNNWFCDKTFHYSGALAFYIILSLGPFLIFLIAITGSVIGNNEAKKAIIVKVNKYIGSSGSKIVNSVVKNVKSVKHGFFPGILSLVIVFLGATAIFSQVQSIINLIWNIPRSKTGFYKFIIVRLRSFLMIMCIGFVFLLSVLLNSIVSVISSKFGMYILGNFYLLKFSSFMISFLLITLLFTFVYKIFPDKKILWGDAWIGSIITSCLFFTGQLIINFYLGKSDFGSFYGAAGSLAVFLVWIYYSTLIFFFGAQFTYIYSERKK